jgi:PAS domain S-box-containing protein
MQSGQPRDRGEPVAQPDPQAREASDPTSPDSAERLRAIVETAVDGILTIDERGIVETMNPAAVRMFGYPAAAVIGRNITLLMPEPYRSEHDSYLRRYLTTGERRIIGIGREVLGQRSDGSRFPMELAVSEMLLGGRRMFTGIVRDITERRAAEVKLRRLAALLDDSNDAINELDLNGAITSWNVGAERLYGYPPSRAVGMNVRELLPITRADEVAQVIARLVAGEHVAPFETQRITADGRVVDIQCTMTMLKGRGGEPDSIVVTDRDISERKRNEEALRGSEAKTRAIVEAAVDGIITIESDGRIESLNKAAERLFGYPSDELIGRNVSMLMPEPYSSEHDGYVRRYQRTGVKKIIGTGREVVGLRKDGTTFPMDLAISEMVVGERRMFTGIVRDISERKRIETALKHQADTVEQNNRTLQLANTRAEEASAAKGAFLANMSHEIRTPMTAILGFAEQLEDPDLSRDEALSAAATVRRHGEFLLALLNDVLDLSKIEAGRMQVDLVPCQPVQIVGELVALMRPRAVERGLELLVDHDGSFPMSVATDPTRWRQVLLNLLGNAIKFTPTGRIEVRLRGAHHDGQPQAVVEVADTGIGISAEQMSRLFQPFVQADSSTTRRFGGTGLGLSISRRLATMLGGRLTATSEFGKGTCFRFSIPAILPAQVPARTKAPVAAAQAPTHQIPPDFLVDRRILLAEDAPDNRLLLTRILQRAGAEVHTAANGNLALAAVQASPAPFDLIVLDMQMPELDGYGAASQLRRRGYAGPILALTAHAMTGDRERCLAAGCSAYAAKPIDRRTLLAALFDCLSTTVRPT